MTALTLGSRLTLKSGWWRRHPEAPVVGLIALAWIGLAVSHWVNHNAEPNPVWSFGIGGWAAMVVAMMLPGLVPMQRWVARSSLRSRQARASVLFVATYVASWVALGVLAWGIVAAVTRPTGSTFAPGTSAVFVALVVAAAWQFAPMKRRALRRCHLRLPLATRGWAADASVIRYGLFQARACAVSCGPVMLAMFVAAHDFHLMFPLTAVLVYERLRRAPNEALGAVALLAVAMYSLVA